MSQATSFVAVKIIGAKLYRWRLLGKLIKFVLALLAQMVPDGLAIL